MLRSILGLTLLLFSSVSLAAPGSCSVFEMGTWQDYVDAQDACWDHRGSQSCVAKGTGGSTGYRAYQRTFDQNYPSGYPSSGTGSCPSTINDDTTIEVYRFRYTGGDCPPGTDPVAGQCIDPCEGAPDGAAYDSQLEACVCPAGQTDYLDSSGGYSCVEDVPECTPSSSNFTGAWVNNVPICSYDGDCGEGQTGGIVDTGDGPNWICVNEPNCSGTWINGSCISPEDTTSQPDTHTDKDTDGDGVPDSSDDDIDGDGIPNSTDDDIDGDGVLNVDDQSNEKDSQASGGGSCDSAPVCSGDAIHCAQLQQQWLTRCDGDGSYSETNCQVPPVCDGDPLHCQALLNDWEYECATQTAADDAEAEYQAAGMKTADDYAAEGGVFGEGESHDVASVTGDVLASRSAVAGSCPAPKQLDLGVFGTTEITFQAFCDLADMIYWIVMLSAYLTATFIIFRSITN